MGFIGSFTHEGTLEPLKESPVLPGSQSLSDSSDQANSEQNMSTVPGGFCPSAIWPRCLTNSSDLPRLYFGAL